MTSLEELLAGDGFKKGRRALLRFKVGESRPNFFSDRSRSNVSDATRRLVDLAGFRRKSSIQRDAVEIKQEFDDREGGEEYVGGFADRIEEEETAEVERFRARGAEKNQGKPRFRDNNPRSDVNEDARSSRPSEPPLDEAAIGALISILTGSSLRRFFKDENFRASLRHTCLSWLYSSGGNEMNGDNDSRVIANLREAIDIVEGAVKKMPDPRDLRRASLKLTVLAGLSYGDLKNGFTCGIPNLHLSACAHLYLSLFYRLQKKNKASGRHLLQVFCDVPYPGRTVLLLSLWERLIFPHLSHLKAWYEKEAELILRTSSRLQKLQALEEIYNNALDIGTYRFAIYYKEWLIEETGAKPPPFPCVNVPDNPFTCCPNEVSTMVGFEGASSSERLDLYLEEVEEEEVAEERFNVLLRSYDQGNDGEDEDAWSSSPKSSENIEEDQHKSQNEANVPSDLRSMETKPKPNKSGMIPPNSEMASSQLRSSAEPSGIFEVMDLGSVFSGIPNDFVCPLTDRMFKDPVTLETGQTFERAAIMEWFKQGNKTCPVTGRGLKSLSIPVTDFVLKRVMDGWRLEHCRNLLVYATQISRSVVKRYKSKDELVRLIIEQIVSGFKTDEQMENARHFISLGGLHFLTWRLEIGSLEEKMHVVSLMLCCIKADGSCRSFLAVNIEGPWILELLQGKELNARTNAVLLMIELVCLNRLGSPLFLSSLITENIVNTMNALLLCLQTSSPEETALVAVLLLHLDLMVEPPRHSIYRDEAINGILAALEHSLCDGEVIKNASKALLILGGRFSSSGKMMVETWLLQQAGFKAHSRVTSVDYDGEAEENITKEEEKEREEWSNKLALVLLQNRKRPFLGTLFRCLSSKVTEIVKVCLITVAWLSNALPSLSTAGFQLSNFTTLIPILKEIMIKDNQIENKVLSSLSLLNLSTIYECRDLLKTFAEEMVAPLQNLGEVTWSAKQLHTAIYGEN